MACIFCNNQEIKERIVCENEFSFAFPTNIPIVPGHILLCPKKCVSSIDDLTPQEWEGILNLMNIIKPALIQTFQAEGFNYALNEGEVAGQSVPHVHIHLLPRKKGDTGITGYEPRQFLYRPGSRAETQQDELKEIAQDIKQHILP